MESVIFREATLADAEAILSVVYAAFEEYRGRLDPPSGAHSETVEKIRERITKAHAFVALYRDEIVGCVFSEEEEGYMYLNRVGVLPHYRRRGIARELIRLVEAHAQARRYTRVRLSVRVPLTGNRAYYEHLGYHVVEYASHLGYDRPTYVVMEKDVSEEPRRRAQPGG